MDTTLTVTDIEATMVQEATVIETITTIMGTEMIIITMITITVIPIGTTTDITGKQIKFYFTN